MSDLGRDVVAALLHRGGGVFTAEEATAAGVSRSALRWAVERGALVRLRRGAFAAAAGWAEADRRGRHLLELRALQRASPGSVAVGVSAALLLDLPVPEIGSPQLSRLGPVSPVSADPERSLRGPSHFRRPRRSAVWRLDGIRATAPVSTVVDCARQFGRPWGLAVADAALFRMQTTGEELLAEVAARPPSPGLRDARWVAEHARPEPESPLESVARADIVLSGRPEPRPQVKIMTARGLTRVDLLDLTDGVVIEADGKLKYVGEEGLWPEKLRQDALRDLGLEVVRFIWADHHHLLAWLATYDRAVHRARARRHTDWRAALVGRLP